MLSEHLACGWLDRLVILYNPLEAIVFDIIFFQKKKIIHVCFGHETNGLMGKRGEKKSICCSILSLPLWTPEADSIHSPADQPSLPWLTPHYKEHRCLEGRMGKGGRVNSCQETSHSPSASGNSRGREEAAAGVCSRGSHVYANSPGFRKTIEENCCYK